MRRLLLIALCLLCPAIAAVCETPDPEAHNPWVKNRQAPDNGLVSECRLASRHERRVSVAADPEGRAFFIAENCVYTVTDLGIVRVLGGKDTPYSPLHPRALAVDADDDLYILDDHGLTRLYPDGQRYTLIDDASKVTGIALDSDGNTFYSVGDDHQVFLLNWDGVRTLLAGDGRDGMTGDGDPADKASLHNPSGLAVDNDGNVYIVDGTVVRRVNLAGTIDTLVGNSFGGYDLDGIPAAYANSPIYSIAVDDSHNIYLGERGCIRVVDQSGYLRLFIGHGPYGERDDSHLAAASRVRIPVSLAFGGNQAFYFADIGTLMVRKLDRDGYVTSLAGNQGPYDPLDASHERDR